MIPPESRAGYEALRASRMRLTSLQGNSIILYHEDFRPSSFAAGGGECRRSFLSCASCFPGCSRFCSGPPPGATSCGCRSAADPVAYFTDGKPVPGMAEFEYQWHDARWRFASAAHRNLFAKNPEHYAPQYDSYCALGVAFKEPHKDTVDPNAWAIINGKLYLTHTARALAAWRGNAAANIDRAKETWPTVKTQAEPVVVGRHARLARPRS